MPSLCERILDDVQPEFGNEGFSEQLAGFFVAGLDETCSLCMPQVQSSLECPGPLWRTPTYQRHRTCALSLSACLGERAQELKELSEALLCFQAIE